MGKSVMSAELAEVIALHKEMGRGWVMMATEDPPADPPADDDEATPPAPAESEGLGDAGKRALAAERKAARDARQQLADAQAKLQAIEDAGKTELQKATDAAAKAEQEADDARRQLARERVARKHSLSDEDVELLSGDEEQMERLAARLAAAATPPAPADPDQKAPPVLGIDRVPDTRNIPLTDQISAAEKAGEKELVATLKAMQLGTAGSTA